MSQVARIDEQCVAEKMYGDLLIKYENGKVICIKKTVSIGLENGERNGKEKEMQK